MNTRTKPNECTPNRRRPHVIGLLGYYGLSVRRVSQATGRYQQLVTHALDIEAFGNTSYVVVLEVRAATERLLREAGWQGEPAELWAEYDAVLQAQSAA